MPILGAVTQPARGAFRFGKPRIPEFVEYLVIAGGGGAGQGGSGAGGYRNSVSGETSGRNTSAETPLTVAEDTNYLVTVGAAGSSASGNNQGTRGVASRFGSVTTTGGGAGGRTPVNVATGMNGMSGGSGGGGAAWYGPYGPYSSYASAGAGTTGQGYPGGTAYATSPTTGIDGNSGWSASGAGGGAGGQGANKSTFASHGIGTRGAGLESSITGTAVLRAWGGGASAPTGFANSGAGRDSGVVIIRFPKGRRTPTVGAGLTYTDSNSTSTHWVYEFTAGSDNIIWES